MQARLLTAILLLTVTPALFAQSSYLLRARKQVITASVHQDNCIVVHSDGKFHMEETEQQGSKPDVYVGQIDPAQLDSLKKAIDDPALAKLGTLHKGQQGTAEGVRVEIRNITIPRKGHPQSIGITQSDDNPPMPGPVKPVADWVDNQLASNAKADKNAHADHCGGAGAVYVPEAPGSAKHLK